MLWSTIGPLAPIVAVSNPICMDCGLVHFRNASDFALYLLEEAHVATVTGEAFGCPNNIRISYAASMDDIVEAVQRIQQALT